MSRKLICGCAAPARTPCEIFERVSCRFLLRGPAQSGQNRQVPHLRDVVRPRRVSPVVPRAAVRVDFFHRRARLLASVVPVACRPHDDLLAAPLFRTQLAQRSPNALSPCAEHTIEKLELSVPTARSSRFGGEGEMPCREVLSSRENEGPVFCRAGRALLGRPGVA